MFTNVVRRLAEKLTGPPTKLALVIRGDIRMSKGKTASQCAHAAVLCYQQCQTSAREHQLLLEAWSRTGQPKIVLRIDNYEDMMQLERAAAETGVLTAIVRDAGRTQLEPGTATVLGIGPATVTQIDKLVGHLKLL